MNARTLPEVTTRRAALGAIIAAGAAGATTVLPAAASGSIAASESYEDATLFALITEARSIQALQNEADDDEEAAWDRIIWPDRPTALNPRPDDHSLVRPLRAEFDEHDIRELRGLVEDIGNLGLDTKINKVLVKELKTRSREIVDAWDSYQADRDRAVAAAAGLPEINRRAEELNERRYRLWSRIAQTPARTVEGMHAKIAFASIHLNEQENLVGGTMEVLLLSAAMDYAEIYGQEDRT